MKKLFILSISILLFAYGCQQKKAETNKVVSVPIEKNLSNKIEVAHQKDAFLKKEAISFDAEINFGGKQIFNANITITTSSDLAKITYKNGDEIYVKQQDIFVSQSLKENPGVRFHAYTWNYFFLFPYKLNDDGTIWDFNYTTNEKNNTLTTAKLSFESNVGDAPDDWYITYTNKENVLQHVAYIVTLGKTKAAAEADPHAIKYNNYTNINGIPFATSWEFYEWNNKDGLTNKIGNANISNIKFVNDFRSNFAIPKDYIKK